MLDEIFNLLKYEKLEAAKEEYDKMVKYKNDLILRW